MKPNVPIDYANAYKRLHQIGGNAEEIAALEDMASKCQQYKKGQDLLWHTLLDAIEFISVMQEKGCDAGPVAVPSRFIEATQKVQLESDISTKMRETH